MSQNGRLGIVSLDQLVLGSLPHQPGELSVEGVIHCGKGVAGRRKPLGQILSHPHPLSALPGAHQHGHHRMTELPQVKPAPNATRSTTVPRLTRPSLIA